MATPIPGGGPRRRQTQQEFVLPDGRKVVVASADNINTLRKQHANSVDGPELVVHGSTEHTSYLKKTREHHESRRAELKERHGAAFDEWETVQQDLNNVSLQLSKLSTNTSGLHENYGKFGYDAGVRTYDNEEEEEHHSSSNDDAGHNDDEKRQGYRQELTIKLAKIPVVKQWFHRDLLWRASEHTEIMAIELFFDLVYGKTFSLKYLARY